MSLGISWWQMILDQAARDDAVSTLLTKVSEVYDFITEGGTLAEIKSMQATYVKISQQTLVCADFIAHYAETKNACELSPLHHRPPHTQCYIFAQGKDLPRTCSEKLMS